MPFVRTFAPFVAGVAADDAQPLHLLRRDRRHAVGGSWSLAGYLFGNVPWVQQNLSKIIWAMILMPGLVVLYGAWKARRRPAVA
jgi:membrane-associated protein